MFKIVKDESCQPRKISNMVLLQSWRRNKGFPRQTKVEEFTKNLLDMKYWKKLYCQKEEGKSTQH